MNINCSIYHSILQNTKKRKIFALLIDPDKQTNKSLVEILNRAERAGVDLLLVGGSLISTGMDNHILQIKKLCSIPVLLFPGSLLQISDKADGLLLLSLISGRNPELLIGNHVIAAPLLKKSNLEVISTGYILIENGKMTSVEYISNSKPIPADKYDIVVATAIAGEMLGLKLIYLEAGSGAHNRINDRMISEVRKNISIPLVVGGGISSVEDLESVYRAGADIAVVGSAVEKNISILDDFMLVTKNFKV